MARDIKTRRQPERGSRRIRIRPAYIVLLIAMGFFAFKFIEKTRELQQLNQQATALRLANEQTMRDNTRIGNDIKYYRTPRYIEEQARALFGYTEPGDVPIMTKPVVARPAAPDHAEYRAAPAAPSWQEWWDSFFH
jgi:cell division protein FtsB